MSSVALQSDYYSTPLTHIDADIDASTEPCANTLNLPGLFDDKECSVDADAQLPLFNVILPSRAVEDALQKSQHSAGDLWQQIAPSLQSHYGEVIWRSWLRHMQPAGLNEKELILAAPNVLMRDWVERNYGSMITQMARRIQSGLASTSFVIDANLLLIVDDKLAGKSSAGTPLANDNISADDDNLPVLADTKLNPKYTFDQFIVDKSNMLAFNAAQRVAASDEPQFNPLFLQGGVGLGKTHLMHAMAAEIKRRAPGRRVLYISAEQFMYQFVRALRDRSALEFKELFRSVDVLMIDDVQFICGKDSTQEEFFHTFNVLIEQNKQIILSADKSPSDLQGVGARLTSRMGSGLVAEIHATTYELRLGILHAKMLGQHAVAIDKDILEFLAQNISSNVRELVGGFNRLIAHAELTGHPVTLDKTQEILADLLRGALRRVTIDDIQKRVSEHYSIRMSDMQSPRRARQVARPRQVAMYLSKIMTTKSLPDIGRKFGGRDHTTVMHAVKTIESMITSDPALNEDVQLLKRALKAE